MVSGLENRFEIDNKAENFANRSFEQLWDEILPATTPHSPSPAIVVKSIHKVKTLSNKAFGESGLDKNNYHAHFTLFFAEFKI
jgi:hypothetical protein